MKYRTWLVAEKINDKWEEKNVWKHRPSDTNQPPVEVQPSDTNQPPNQEDAGGWLISILLIAVAAVIGIVIKKLTRKKERRGFHDIVKERVLNHGNRN